MAFMGTSIQAIPFSHGMESTASLTVALMFPSESVGSLGAS